MDFYRLRFDEGKRKKFAYGIQINEYPRNTIKCDVCGREWDKDLLLNENTQTDIVMSNDSFPDFSSIVYHFIILNKVRDIFVNENISGYHVGELNIFGKDKLSSSKLKELRLDGFKVNQFSNENPYYYRLFVDGKVELHEKTGMILFESCVYCGYEVYRNKEGNYSPTDYIKEGTWDGSDLFMVKEFGGVVYCSKKFYEIYQKYNMTGLLFTKVEMI